MVALATTSEYLDIRIVGCILFTVEFFRYSQFRVEKKREKMKII